MQAQPKAVAADDRNAASETLMQIVELVLPFRTEDSECRSDRKAGSTELSAIAAGAGGSHRRTERGHARADAEASVDRRIGARDNSYTDAASCGRALLEANIDQPGAPAVNRLVAGSNPARGATANQGLSAIRILQFHPVWHAIGTRTGARPLH